MCILPWLPIDSKTEKQPDQCLHMQGNLALMKQDYLLARIFYQRSIEKNKNNLDAHRYLASIYEKKGEINKAIEMLLPVITTFPDHFPTLKKLGILEAKQGNLSQAIQYMGRAYRVPGNRSSTGLRYVRMLMRAGREEEARKIIEADEGIRRKMKNLP